MNKKNNILLGAHISTKGGLHLAIERAEKLQCTTMQIFTRNNRQWITPSLTEQEVTIFLEKKRSSNIQIIIAHASYLINIGSPNPDIQLKSKNALIDELYRCDQLEITYLILHPGSHVNTNEKTCMNKIIETINSIFEQKEYKAILLLETMAGQGSTVGSTIEQLTYLINNINKKKFIGVCIDTCHIFAAGYNLNTQYDYNRFLQIFNQNIGIEYIKVIHINDSKKQIGSNIDRHEHIGYGYIGINAFRYLMNDKQFSTIPKILETPIENNEYNDINKNIQILKALIEN